MELRVLRYFLTVAREGSITKAAEMLHMTQPTLSRQLMNLEEELGTALFLRGRHQTLLTEEGVLFEQRVEEIISLVDKTEQEFIVQKDQVSGVVSIGCVESTAMKLLPEILERFTEKYPRVQYDLYSGYGNDIKEKIDKGLIDLGIMTEPVEVGKYDSVVLPQKERWGLLMPEDALYAGRETLDMSDLAELPLIIPKRELLRSEIANWCEEFDRLHIVATYNLLFSAVLLVERGIGCAVCLDGASVIGSCHRTVFVPFSPERITSNVLIWKRSRGFSPAASLFMEFVKSKLYA